MNIRLFILFVGISIILSCQSKPEQSSDEKLDPNTHKVVVQEVDQTTTYTYLKVSENDEEYWIAISKRDINEDDILYYETGLEMHDFVSKDLDRTFETIYFVDKIGDKPIKKSQSMMANSPHSNVQSNQKEGISVSPAEGGITIAELFSNKEKYKGKSVKISGQVVKYNAQIMGRNWVHIQDGTGYENNFDLTITTNASVKMGDIVTFEGKIALSKDFGAGYSYDVLMEEAKLNPSK